MKKTVEKFFPKFIFYFIVILAVTSTALFFIAFETLKSCRYQWETCYCKGNYVQSGSENLYEIVGNDDGHLNGKVRVCFDTKGTRTVYDDKIIDIYVIEKTDNFIF